MGLAQAMGHGPTGGAHEAMQKVLKIAGCIENFPKKHRAQREKIGWMRESERPQRLAVRKMKIERLQQVS